MKSEQVCESKADRLIMSTRLKSRYRISTVLMQSYFLLNYFFREKWALSLYCPYIFAFDCLSEPDGWTALKQAAPTKKGRHLAITFSFGVQLSVALGSHALPSSLGFTQYPSVAERWLAGWLPRRDAAAMSASLIRFSAINPIRPLVTSHCWCYYWLNPYCSSKTCNWREGIYVIRYPQSS